MNTRIRNGLFLLYPFFLATALAPARGAVSSVDGDPARTNSTTAPVTYVVAKSGDGQTWQSVKSITNRDGIVTFHTNRIQELNTGMHYFDTESNDWRPSDPTFVETVDQFS